MSCKLISFFTDYWDTCRVPSGQEKVRKFYIWAGNFKDLINSGKVKNYPLRICKLGFFFSELEYIIIFDV